MPGSRTRSWTRCECRADTKTGDRSGPVHPAVDQAHDDPEPALAQALAVGAEILPPRRPLRVARRPLLELGATLGGEPRFFGDLLAEVRAAVAHGAFAVREVRYHDEPEQREQVLVVAVDALALLLRRRLVAVHDSRFRHEGDAAAALDDALAERDVLAEPPPAEAILLPARAPHAARDVVKG